MNKFGFLSLSMVLISVAVFFIVRGPDASLSFMIIALGSLSALGVLFAVLSRKWLTGAAGVLLNGTVLVFAYFLLLAKGIGG
ncbi:hypothetical protein LCM10_03410 [Rossellomorea aquimaris]|uniref:hypothetical protein n=1 Tax=Rossellomorea aquimaris TaxID=189382 RepID=UPI001CD2D0F7|nr:hypothetical protein [Rossellomorea aquimaris]MCA1054024.1 hypothetical protein [Rossellomorea aquimaris]